MSWVSDGQGGNMCLLWVNSDLSSFARKVGSWQGELNSQRPYHGAGALGNA